jgi:hypothetical protein
MAQAPIDLDAEPAGAVAFAPVVVPIERHRVQDHLVDEPRRARRGAAQLLSGPLGVALVVAVAGIAAAIWAAQHDLLAYADARSHLTISRRLIDGPNRGFVQIGTVWLPFQHLVMVPFVAVRGLWASGWAAVPVGIACLVVEALGVYGIVTTLVRSRLAGWVAALLATTTPAVLYLHTTALTEPVLYAALIVTAYALTRWAVQAKPASSGEMAVVCGIPALAATLARYDGWAFVVAGSGFVAWVSWARWRRTGYSWRMVRAFVALPAFGAAWWLWFNWINYGDPLAFQRGEYSAQAQQDLLERAGLLPDQGHVLRSVATFADGVLRGAGWPLVVAGILGMAVWAWRSRVRFWGLAPWLLMVVPAGFYVLSLYTGQVVMRVHRTSDQGLFNLRYGVALIAGLAVFAGLAVAAIEGRGLRPRPSEWRLTPASPAWGVEALSSAGAAPPAVRRDPRRTALAALVGAALVVAAMSQWSQPARIGVVAEGREQLALNRDVRACAEWLRDEAGPGRLLIDDSVHPMLPVIGMDLDRVLAPFIGDRRWERALSRPERARYLFADTANPADAVATATAGDPALAGATTVCRAGSVEVLDTSDAGEGRR